MSTNRRLISELVAVGVKERRAGVGIVEMALVMVLLVAVVRAILAVLALIASRCICFDKKNND